MPGYGIPQHVMRDHASRNGDVALRRSLCWGRELRLVDAARTGAILVAHRCEARRVWCWVAAAGAATSKPRSAGRQRLGQCERLGLTVPRHCEHASIAGNQNLQDNQHEHPPRPHPRLSQFWQLSVTVTLSTAVQQVGCAAWSVRVGKEIVLAHRTVIARLN